MEEIIQETLSKGVEMHVAGEFDLAGQLYASVLKLQPNHADANHNMGLLRLDIGDDAEALSYLQTALQADTTIAQFWISYIKALIKLQRLDETGRILELAKESGFEGGEFAELNQLLNTPTENASVSVPETGIPTQSEPNILDSLKLNQALRLAEKKAKDGDAEEALGIYKDIMAKFPKNKRARQGLAALNKPKQPAATKGPPQETTNKLVNLYNQGQLAAVVEQAQTLIKQYPDAFMIWNILGAATAQTGNLEQAIDAFKKVISLKPDDISAYNNLGNALEDLGEFAEALEIYNSALSIKPNNATIYNNLGKLLSGHGKQKEAIEAYNKAISLKPNYDAAHFNLGITLQQQGKLKEAIHAYTRALSINPNNAEAYGNIGITFHHTGKLDEAIEAYTQALLIKPSSAKTQNNMGNALQEQGKLVEALEAYRKAISINPNFAKAFNNLGNVLKYHHNFTEAVCAFAKAISLAPDYADAHYNMGRLYWLEQNFTKAFELMEWRWKRKQDEFNGTPLDSSRLTWNGEPGKRVFVWKEQGVGDEIMFSSTLFELNRKSQKLIVECDKRLIPIYRRSFPSNIKFVDDRNKVGENEYNAQIAVGSLLKHFRRDISDFEKVSSSWLKADSEKISALRRRLQSHKNDKIIGISWFTRAKKATSQWRNLPIGLFANYLKKLPATYVNLQYGETTEELSQIRSKSGLEVKQIDNLDLFNDLEGLAALISACDIVISIDNATVHLAGALGIDTRILLPFNAEERWGLNSSKSYWYDSVTLYRQEILRDWNKPLENLICDIKNTNICRDEDPNN